MRRPADWLSARRDSNRSATHVEPPEEHSWTRVRFPPPPPHPWDWRGLPRVRWLYPPSDPPKSTRTSELTSHFASRFRSCSCIGSQYSKPASRSTVPLSCILTPRTLAIAITSASRSSRDSNSHPPSTRDPGPVSHHLFKRQVLVLLGPLRRQRPQPLVSAPGGIDLLLPGGNLVFKHRLSVPRLSEIVAASTPAGTHPACRNAELPAGFSGLGGFERQPAARRSGLQARRPTAGFGDTTRTGLDSRDRP